MKTDWSHLDKYREPTKIVWENGHPQTLPFGSRTGATYGSFCVPMNGAMLLIIANDTTPVGDEVVDKLPQWEHVSVHAYDPIFRKNRTPTWAEMCHVKSLFWNDNEVAMELHVAKADWISVHDHTLHLWRPVNEIVPLPPKIYV